MVFECNQEISIKERQAYIDHVCKKHGCKEESIISLKVAIPNEGEDVDLEVRIDEPKMERIRRIR